MSSYAIPPTSLTDEQVEALKVLGKKIQGIRRDKAGFKNTEEFARALGWFSELTNLPDGNPLAQIERGGVYMMKYKKTGESIRRPIFGRERLEQVIQYLEDHGHVEVGELVIPYDQITTRKRNLKSRSDPKQYALKTVSPDDGEVVARSEYDRVLEELERANGRIRTMEREATGEAGTLLAEEKARHEEVMTALTRERNLFQSSSLSANKRAELAENQVTGLLGRIKSLEQEIQAKPGSIDPMSLGEVDQLVLELGLNPEMELNQEQIARLALALRDAELKDGGPEPELSAARILQQVKLISSELTGRLRPFVGIISGRMERLDSRQQAKYSLVIIDQAARMLAGGIQVLLWLAALQMGGETGQKAINAMAAYFQDRWRPQEEERKKPARRG